jgi:hypothetical protein
MDIMSKKSKSEDYSVVTVGPLKPHEKDGKHHLTIMAESINLLQKTGAKAFAYEQRFSRGLGNAGIEIDTGPITVDSKGKPVPGQSKDHTHYAVTYKFTPGI